MKDKLGIALRGLCMGAADAVPGVSGGTVALIAGIYARLIAVIGAVGPGLWPVWRSRGVKGVWDALDGGFALPLVIGIAAGLLGLSKLVLLGLESQPALVWAIFLGLVLAAVPMLARSIPRWSLSGALCMAMGLGVAAGLGALEVTLPHTQIGFAVGGLLALSAMILPGLSGSFVLLLLGLYQPVFSALHALDWAVILPFAGGALVGLVGMARVLAWLFKRHEPQVMAALIGLMLGSCVQLWPFAHAPLTAMNGVTAAAGVVVGVLAVWGLDRWSSS